jgi:hypothetical protein
LSADGDKTLDRWTIAAIGLIAYCAANLIHEAGGHGGACLLVGGKPKILNAIFFNYDESTVSAAGRRFIVAGGSVLNVLVGGVLLLVLRLRLPPRARYFTWLLMTLNFVTAFGYLCFSGVGGIGDWSVIIEGLPHHTLWRVLEVVAGLILYFGVAPMLTWSGIAPFIGAGPDRVRRARRLTLLPYFVGGFTFVAAGALNPLGFEILLISAVAASFGGSSLLAWFYVMRADKLAPGAPAALGIARSRVWIAAAVVCLAIFVGVLGRGITF